MVESVVQSHGEIVVDSTEKKLVRVLHVDDEPALLRVTKQCLELEGMFQVDSVSSVEEAMAKLEKERYDAVVSDYQMPGKDGLEFLKELRENGDRTPFIMFTGKGREEVAIKALNLGANQYLNKTGETETVYTELAHAITELAKIKKAEELLRLSEEKYRGLFESARDVIVLFDLKGNVTSINKMAEEYGFNRSEMLGKNMLKFVSKRHWPRLLKDVAQTALGKTAKGRIDIHTPKGNRMATYRSKPIFSDNRVVGIQAILEDLTEHEEAEEVLRQSEEKYRSLFEDSSDGLVLVDRDDGSILDCNPEFMRQTGRNKEQLLKMKIWDIRPSHLREAAKKKFFDVKQKGFGGSMELAFQKPSGETVLVDFLSKTAKVGDREVLQSRCRDITEHRKAEESLRESEEKYKDLFENAMDAIVTLDLKGSITAVNNSALRLGYKKEDLIGKNLPDFVSKEYWPAVMRDFSKVTQGEPAKNEIELIVPAGKIIGEYYARAIVKENNVAGVQVNIRDVTERKKSEELLRESEERFRGLFESIQDPVGIFVGREGRLIDYNTAFKKSSGYTDEELKGKAFLDFVHPDDHAMVLEKYRTEYSEDEFPLIYEIRGVNKKEECIPLELSVSTYKKKGKVIGIEVIHRDLTERKKGEMSLRESQGRFEGLFQGNPEAATYLGPDYRVQDINPRFEKLFGYSLEEVNGKHINDVVVPDGRREEGETLDRDARKGYVYRNTVRRKKDGSLVQVSVSAAPIANESGVTGIVAMYKDISDLKNAEKRMDVMNEKLRVVGGLTRHDIRNKLTAVAGNAYLLRKRFASEPNAIECLEGIETAVQESERIFDFASAYERLGIEQLAYVDAKKILDEAVTLFPDLKGVKIVKECGGLTVLADSLLRQLFYNLIDDSLKYGEKLTQIRVRYEESEDQLKLVYEDDGVGISKDVKAKLFTEGFTTGKGSGYGLYLIRRMMDVYGWTIDETGVPGKGAKFTISIPRAKPDGRQNYKLS